MTRMNDITDEHAHARMKGASSVLDVDVTAISSMNNVVFCLAMANLNGKAVEDQSRWNDQFVDRVLSVITAPERKVLQASCNQPTKNQRKIKPKQTIYA